MTPSGRCDYIQQPSLIPPVATGKPLPPALDEFLVLSTVISDSLRQRIAALNKGRLHNESAASDSAAVSDDALPESRVRPGPPPGFPTPVTLTEAMPELQQARLPGGSCGLLDRPMSSFFTEGCDAFLGRFRRCIDSLEHPWVYRMLTDRLSAISGIRPESFLFVDIEATGFTSGTPLFLVGTFVCEPGNGFRLRQYLARDYGEEGVILSLFTEQLEKAGAVVSFNGKRYDLPYLRDRSAYHAVPFPFTQPHIDLLHESRARFRHRLPNCRLQTLEQHLCHRVRTGDIPGEEIPDAYHRFVRTGNALEMREIIHHNALDLITLAEMMLRVLMEPVP